MERMKSQTAIDLEPLRAFGSFIEQHKRVAVDVGGILTPGPDSTESFSPGKEKYVSERTNQEGNEAGRSDARRQGSGSGPSQAETAPCPPRSRPLGLLSSLRGRWRGDGITEAELDELEVYYPDVRVTFSSSRFVYLGLTAQPFASIPIGARFSLEVPRPGHARYSWPQIRIVRRAGQADPLGTTRNQGVLEVTPMLVPAVRVWARWIGGPLHGMSVISHHRYPDMSLCVCESRNWLRGVHPLIDYVGMCVASFANILHEAEIGFYPGRQHYPEWSRIERDMPAEFCGCGSRRRYAECHRRADQALPPSTLIERERGIRCLYYKDLRRQSRPAAPPPSAWL
jgi:hypothetical protein